MLPKCQAEGTSCDLPLETPSPVAIAGLGSQGEWVERDADLAVLSGNCEAPHGLPINSS